MTFGTTRNRTMLWLVTKYFLTAAVVVLVSEAAKRSDRLGSFIAALPLVTVLALIWLFALAVRRFGIELL